MVVIRWFLEQGAVVAPPVGIALIVLWPGATRPGGRLPYLAVVALLGGILVGALAGRWPATVQCFWRYTTPVCEEATDDLVTHAGEEVRPSALLAAAWIEGPLRLVGQLPAFPRPTSNAVTGPRRRDGGRSGNSRRSTGGMGSRAQCENGLDSDSLMKLGGRGRLPQHRPRPPR